MYVHMNSLRESGVNYYQIISIDGIKNIVVIYQSFNTGKQVVLRLEDLN
jgi:hypothetical protein